MKIEKLLAWYCFECHQHYRVKDEDDDEEPGCCSGECAVVEAYWCGACGEMMDDCLDHRCVEDALIPRCPDCNRPGQKLISTHDTAWWCTRCHERLEWIPTLEDLDDLCVGESIELPDPSI